MGVGRRMKTGQKCCIWCDCCDDERENDCKCHCHDRWS